MVQLFLSKWRFLTIIFLIIALVSGCAATPAPQNPVPDKKPQVGLGIGDLAPDFTITMNDGKTLKLSELRGKPVFLNFWASWCPPCKREMPDIEKIYKDNRSVQIVAINLKESPMEVRSFLTNNGYTFPVGFDPKGEIAGTYMVTGIPTSYGIDRNGIIRYQIQGPLTYAQLNQWFSTLEQIK